MKLIRLAIAAALISTPALAANNTVIVTPGAGVTMCSKDTGAGVEAMCQSVVDPATGNSLLVTNANSAVANQALNLPSLSYNMGYNGTTWDQIQVDASKNLKVIVNGALAAGANVIGGVTVADGSNIALGAKADTAWVSGSGSAVAILKTIAAGVAAVIPTQVPTVSIGGVGIVDSAGTNVATVKAASTIPAATDKTLVVGINPGTSVAGTPTGAIVTVQGVAAMTKLLVTPDSVALPANQSVNVAQIAGVATPVGSGVQATAPRMTLATDSPGITTLGGATTANSMSVIPNSQYPANSVTTAPTPKASIGAGTTGAVTANIAAVASVTNYLCGFDVSAIGGTAAIGPVTITGLLGGTLTYQMTSTAGGVTLQREFNMCIPASAVNTAITITTTADGTATAVDVDLHGYTL